MVMWLLFAAGMVLFCIGGLDDLAVLPLLGLLMIMVSIAVGDRAC